MCMNSTTRVSRVTNPSSSRQQATHCTAQETKKDAIPSAPRE